MAEEAEAPLNLAELTADIVASYVAANPVSASELPGLISSVFGALVRIDSPAPAQAATEAPKTLTASQIRKSIAPDAITCFACGRSFKTLRRHLRTEHGFEPGDYIAAFGLPRDYPLISEATSKVRSDFAKSIGLGRKRAAPATQSKPAKKPRPPKAIDPATDTFT